MTDPSNADIVARIDHLTQVVADHSEVDRQAHTTAAADRALMKESFDELKGSVAGLVEVWNSLTGFSKLLSWIGTFVKWIGGVAIILGALWAWLKSGKPPSS